MFQVKKQGGLLLILILLAVVMVFIVASVVRSSERGYQLLSMADGVKLMNEEPESLLVDVRTVEEYESGHIPGAVLLPIAEIREGNVAEMLPDPEQCILLYCRTGRRAEDSAALLAGMGYTRLYSIGGIVDWPGEVVIGMNP